jgi:hypothetical protein
MAAPLGPPPRFAITRIFPSGVTRESVRRSISTKTIEPSGMATGPSGKRRPEAISLILGVMVAMTRVSWGLARRRRQPVEHGQDLVRPWRRAG